MTIKTFDQRYDSLIGRGDDPDYICTEFLLRQEIAELRAENIRINALADKWNLECDEMREDNKQLAGEMDKIKQQEPVAWSITVGDKFENCIEITHCKDDAIAQYEVSTEGGFESIYTFHNLYLAAGAQPDGNDLQRHCDYVAGFDEGYKRAEQQPVPPGYQLVPVEPTEAMLQAIFLNGRKSLHGAYRAMLEAAKDKPCTDQN